MINGTRRPLATLSLLGVTHLHRQNPYAVLWWTAAFPGFGHYLLNQYLRATLLTLSEVITNTLAHVNEGIAYSFCGNIERAKAVIKPEWAFGYLIIYLLAIWDSYRSAVMQNKLCQLAEMENAPIKCMYMHPIEIQYLEQRNPHFAALFSLFFPGMGQVYNHRIDLGLYAMFWWWFYSISSHAYQSVYFILVGNTQKALSVINIHWLLFMPSVLGGAAYHAYITAIDHNQLFRMEQRQFLKDRYENSHLRFFDRGG